MQMNKMKKMKRNSIFIEQIGDKSCDIMRKILSYHDLGQPDVSEISIIFAPKSKLF